MKWKQGHAPSSTFLLHKFFHEYKNKAMALSAQQLLNGQRMLSIPGLSSFSSCSFGRSFFFGSYNIGSLNGKSMELCGELVRREVGICCIQEMRWRSMGSKSVGSSGRRFKLWWSGNEDKIGGVGILVREDLCMNVVEINRISNRVTVVVIIFGKNGCKNCLRVCPTM